MGKKCKCLSRNLNVKMVKRVARETSPKDVRLKENIV